MHHGAAGKIEDAVIEQPSAVAPDPMRQRTRDQRRPQQDEQHVARQLHPLRDRAGNQRRRDDRKFALEHNEDQLGNVLVAVHRVVRISTETELVPIEADDFRVVRAEAQHVSDDDPLNAQHRHPEEAVHHRREDVLAANQPAVKHGQTRSNQPNKCAACQLPGGASCVDR